MMVTRKQIVDEARTWLGTPFHHQARIKGVGVDCAGVIAGTANALGISDFDATGYSHTPSGSMIVKILEKQMNRIDISELKFGDVILFKFDQEPQHLAFYTDIGILHAYGQVRKCVETSFDETWKNRVVGAYRFKGFA